MVMTAGQAASTAAELKKIHDADRAELDILRLYWTGRQALPAVIPGDAPREVHEMARKSRVNIIKIVVESFTQSLIVDNIRASDDRDDPVVARAWQVWQANGMDRRQSGLVRATTAYGTGYLMVLPGRPASVMRPMSPRRVTAVYGDDDLWPVHALERRRDGTFRLYDAEAVYVVAPQPGTDTFEVIGDPMVHNAGVTPVVRFQDVEDLDLEDEPADATPSGMGLSSLSRVVAGQVSPLVPLQDSINMTSFALKAAEWYSAFRQKWIKGKALTDQEKLRSGASQLWSFDEDPDRIALGEFSQTDLRGYIESRGEAAKFAATLSQTPVHELIGELVNLSAEALAAAEIGRDRAVGERRTGQGESYEQALRLAVAYEGQVLPDDVEVRYRDTSARAFGAVVDGLGKIAQMLQVPPQELWEKIPGATRQDVERWRKAFEAGDPIAQMNDLLDRQGAGGTRRGSGLILPPGVQV